LYSKIKNTTLIKPVKRVSSLIHGMAISYIDNKDSYSTGIELMNPVMPATQGLDSCQYRQ